MSDTDLMSQRRYAGDILKMQARIAELEAEVKSLASMLLFVEVFVKSRERIKRPEGEDMFDEVVLKYREGERDE